MPTTSGSGLGNTDFELSHAGRMGPPRIFKFGAFELRTETGELWKHGIRVKLQIKPLQVLIALLSAPGELVTREELCQRLWPAGTFVDFESGLNTATNRLRAALGDSAECPRYIETLPRLGYRFICPVTAVVPENPVKSWAAAVSSVQPAGTETRIVAGGDLPETKGEPFEIAPQAENKPVPMSEKKLSTRWRAVFLSAPAIVLLSVFGYLQSRANATHGQPTFHLVTFRTGAIDQARFLPGSNSIVYTATWQSGEQQTQIVNQDGSASRVLNVGPGLLASISRAGSLAFISIDSSQSEKRYKLLDLSLSGKLTEVIADGVGAADWSPAGHELAAIRLHGSESLVEFPVEHVVYSSRGWISDLRVSPRGDRVAFIEHPVRDDDGGLIRVVDKKANTSILASGWNSARGLAWAPVGDEVWFTASRCGLGAELYAVSGTQRLRELSHNPSSLRLLDISPEGRVLLAVDDTRMNMIGSLPGSAGEINLSNLDSPHADDISRDGKVLLYTEAGEAGGQHYQAYIRDQRAGTAFRIGTGRGLALSPDGDQVLTIDPQDRTALTVTAIKTGETHIIHGEGFEYQWARFIPDSRNLLVGGSKPGEALAICTQNVDGGRPAPVSGAPYMDMVMVSPDAKKIAGLTLSKLVVFDWQNKTTQRVLPNVEALPVAWSNDSTRLCVILRKGSNFELSNLDMKTEKLGLWKAILPKNVAGPVGLASVVAAPDANAYAYSTNLKLSRLYVADGWS